jgi:hypothetical protein
MTDAVPGPAHELPLLVGAAGGIPEELLLVGAPLTGRVTIRRWSAAGWGDGPTLRTEDAPALLRWIEAQQAAGRSLNQSVYTVRLWLTGQGDRLR